MNRLRALLIAACTVAVVTTGLLVTEPARAATQDWIDPAYRSWSTGPGNSETDSSGRLLVVSGTKLTRLLVDGGVDESYTAPDLPAAAISNLRLDGVRAVVNSWNRGPSLQLRRFTGTGALDTGFADEGVLTVAGTGSLGVAFDYDTSDDGSLMVVLTTANATSGPFTTTLKVYTPDGRPDPSFGNGGAITLPEREWDLEAEPGGKPVLVTIDSDGGQSIHRYGTDGKPDASFSGDGVLRIEDDVAVNGIRMQAGGITVAGHRYQDDGSFQAYAGRITASGAWDATFGTQGRAFAPARPCDPVGLDAHLAGQHVYLTSVNDCGNSPGYLSRFSLAGRLDTGFGSDGLLTIDAANDAHVTEAKMDPRPDGRMVLSLDTQRDTRDGTGIAGLTAVLLADTPAAPVPGAFQPLTPTRVLDTRQGLGAPKLAVAADGTIGLQILGRGGVPVSAGAVVLNITAVAATRACAITVYASGSPVPMASNLNCSPGRTTPNLVTVKVGTDGKVNLRNGSTGTTQLIADVAGYFQGGTATAAGAFVPSRPTRVLDTRVFEPINPNEAVSMDLFGTAGIPFNASAVVLNLTAVAPQAAGVIKAYPAGTPSPSASNLNFVAGQTIANLATVKIGGDGRVTLRNSSAGTTHLLADLAGYYLGGTPTLPGTFVALAPTRVLDSRSGLGAAKAPVEAGGTIRLSLASRAKMPAVGIGAVVLNTTVTQPTSNGLVTVWPDRNYLPVASNLNFTRGQTVANLVAVKAGPRGVVDLRVGGSGTVHLISDVAGYFLDPALS